MGSEPFSLKASFPFSEPVPLVSLLQQQVGLPRDRQKASTRLQLLAVGAVMAGGVARTAAAAAADAADAASAFAVGVRCFVL